MLAEAVVGAVAGKADQRYAVAYLSEPTDNVSKDEAVTFSLKVWKGECEPQRGQVVLLGRIEKFVKGWRALYAKPVILKLKKPKQ